MNSSLTSFAELYHQQTKYCPETIHLNAHKLDWGCQPSPFKEYRDLQHIDLSSYVPLSTNPFSNAPLKRSSQWTELEKPLAELSRILYFGNGVTAIVPYPPSPLLMRAAPSAGGLYPNELYVISKNYQSGVGSGLFNYQVKTHSICQIAQGDSTMDDLQEICFGHPALKDCDLAIVVTGVFERSTWRYQDRAYRRVLLDAGHILGNLSMISYLFDRKAYLLGGFHDDKLNALLKLNQDQEQALFVLALPALQKAREVSLVNHPAALTSLTQPNFPSAGSGKSWSTLHELSKIKSSPSKDSINLIDVTLQEYLSQPQDSKLESFLSGESLKCSTINWERCALMTAILKRRSARKYDPNVSITKEQLAKVLQFAYNPQDYKNDGFDEKPVFMASELLKTYLIINNVEGLDSGCYCYQPEQKSLKQVRFKKLTEESHSLCLSQELGRDASVLVIHVCDLKEAVKIYGERAYRYVHADAGHIGQRLNLACVKLGLGVSGIGGFFDDMTNEVLGVCPEDIIVYITTIGNVEYEIDS
jgi:SagB-type dehydrogenase family enzyme